MRPQDVPILLKIISFERSNIIWKMKDLARELGISPSEISESLNRSYHAQLIDYYKRNVFRLALHEFVIHAIGYVFPQSPGPITRGIRTAHSAPPINKVIRSDQHYVWPDAEGDTRGQAIEPLYPTLVRASKQDEFLYTALALIDALRVGRAREKEIAKIELEKMIVRREKY
jgi:hypothetical protein